MSLIRQIWWLLLATVAVAFVASEAVHVRATRDLLETQMRLKNNDNANALAQVLSQQQGRPETMELLASAQFDTGFYRSIRFVGTDGRIAFQREAPAAPRRAPAWFVALVPIAQVPGSAQVSDGWRALGRVEVSSQVSYAHDELWAATLQAGWALAAIGVGAGIVAALGVKRLWRPLDDTVEQAASLERGEYLTVTEPAAPEMRRLARAMNSLVGRLRVVFESQAAQVEALRRQASFDELTGVSNRTHFMAQLAAALQREDGHATGGLILVRLMDLAALNASLGHAGTDRVLVILSETLHDWTAHVAGSFAGRLNGADFAVALPQGGVALESANAVVELLRHALASVAGGVGIAAGAIETQHGVAMPALLGAADLALASAENAGPYAVHAGSTVTADWAALGERGWRERVRDALAEGRARLASFPVVDRDDRLIHLECPLRLQLEPEGVYEVAALWLPLAIRGRMTGDADQRALALALDAIAVDGRPRCVNLSPASLADAGFAGRLRAILLARPDAARQVWIEINESAAADQFEQVRELARQLRAAGARFGLEHAGERLSRIDRLFEAEIDYVKLGAAVARGVAGDAHRAGFLRGLVAMLRGLSLQIIAEGVDDERDAIALFTLGVDGVTGPWVRSRETAAG